MTFYFMLYDTLLIHKELLWVKYFSLRTCVFHSVHYIITIFIRKHMSKNNGCTKDLDKIRFAPAWTYKAILILVLSSVIFSQIIEEEILKSNSIKNAENVNLPGTFHLLGSLYSFSAPFLQEIACLYDLYSRTIRAAKLSATLSFWLQNGNFGKY